ADPERMRFIRELDLGPEAARGIGAWPAEEGKRLPALVPAVDADGNDIAGVRMPDVAVPLAAYTGWNPRHRRIGAPDQLVRYVGSTLPFPPTDAAARAAG